MKEVWCTWDPMPSNLPTTYVFTYKLSHRKKWKDCPDSVTKGPNSCYFEQSLGTLHNMRVVATNDLGSKVWQFNIDPDTQSKPDPPEDVKVIAETSNIAAVSWKIPSEWYSSHFTLLYKLQYYSEWEPNIWSEELDADTQLSYTLTSLDAYTCYTIHVATKSQSSSSDEYWSDWSTPSVGCTKEAAPEKGLEVNIPGQTLKGGLRNVTIRWQRLTKRQARGEITQYRMTVKDEDDPSKADIIDILDGNATEYTLQGLEVHKSYIVTVIALNTAGPSPPSFIRIVDKTQAPGPPSITEAKNLTESSIYIAWTAPSDPNGIISNYVLSYIGNSGNPQWKTITIEGSVHNYTVGDLLAYVQYEFKIQAKNELGYSDNSKAVRLYTKEGVPSAAPRNLTLQSIPSNPTSLQAMWKAPCVEDRNGIILKYKLTVCPRLSNGTCSGQDITMVTYKVSYPQSLKSSREWLSFEIGGLQPNSEYIVSASALTAAGEGPATGYVSQRTSIGAPRDIPDDVKLVPSSITDTEMTITWTHVPSYNVTSTGYEVIAVTQNNTLHCRSWKTHTTDSTITLKNLCGYETYKVVVRACSDALITDPCGDKSEPVYGRTDIGSLISCTPEQYPCNSGGCISVAWHCDGDHDCPDASDEQDCAARSCAPELYPCNSGGCIPVAWHCDGDHDCPDANDEQDCATTLGVPGITTQGGSTQTPTPSKESKRPGGRGPSTVTSSTKRTMEPNTSIDASPITYTLPTVASHGTNESLATASSNYIATTPLPSSTKTQGATETQTPIPSGESQKSGVRGPSTVKSSTKRIMVPRRLAMTSIDASPITYTLPTVASPGTNESLATASTKYIATTPLPSSTKTQGLSKVRGVPTFAPLVGPVSGGTLITINGYNANVDVLFVLIAGQPCNIIRDNEMKNSTKCYTSRVEEPIESAITMVYKNGNLTSDKVFSYKPDPEISAITPLKQFQIGGQRQTIRGQNLNIIGQAVFVVTAITNASSIEFCSKCEAQNWTTMFCPSPQISFRDLNHSSCNAYRNSGRWVEGMQTHEDRQNTTAKVKRDVEDDCNSITSSSASGEDIKLTVGFYLDAVEKWRPQNIGRYLDTTYDVMEDPMINKFPGENNIYSISENAQYLVITGERLNCGAQKEDFTVEVGLDYCKPIISLHRRQLTCKPPREKPPSRLDNEANHGYPQVRVKIGSNKKFYGVGYLRYVVVQPWVIVLATIAVFLLIVAVTITVVCLIRRKSRHKAAETQIEARYMDLQPMNSAADLTRWKEMSITLDSELQSRIKDVMIDSKRLILRTDDVLGRGAFGVVMLGTLQTTQSSACSSGYEGLGQEVAVKILKHNASGDESVNFLEEGLLMKDLQHPNVLTLIGICIDDRGVPMIILPYMKFGNLKTFIQDEDREFTVWDLVSLGHQVASGMRYLSEIHMVHRDLAARNCMVDETKKVKVGDFGLSRDIYQSDYYVCSDKKAKLPAKWMAPECFRKQHYDTKTDVWAYGVLLWEIMTKGETPYPAIDNCDLLDYLDMGKRLQKPPNTPDEVYDIMHECWQLDPDLRPDFKDIVHTMGKMLKSTDEESESNYYLTPVSSEYIDVY